MKYRRISDTSRSSVSPGPSASASETTNMRAVSDSGGASVSMASIAIPSSCPGNHDPLNSRLTQPMARTDHVGRHRCLPLRQRSDGDASSRATRPSRLIIQGRNDNAEGGRAAWRQARVRQRSVPPFAAAGDNAPKSPIPPLPYAYLRLPRGTSTEHGRSDGRWQLWSVARGVAPTTYYLVSLILRSHLDSLRTPAKTLGGSRTPQYQRLKVLWPALARWAAGQM